MKKTKIFFSLIVSMILLFSITGLSKATVAVSSTTPSTVYSGSDFEITLKLSEKSSAFNAHVIYKSNDVTLYDDSEDAYTSINAKYGVTEEDKEKINNEDLKNAEDIQALSLMYAPTKGNVSTDTITIKAKACEVTEEKTTTLLVTSMQAVSESDSEKSEPDKFEINITIKPNSEIAVSESSVSLTVGESKTITATGTGTLTWSSSNTNVATVDSNGKITAVSAGTAVITVKDENGNSKEIKVTVVANSSSANSSSATSALAKTGESEILAISICGLILIVAIVGIRFKKINKLFVMLPILFALTVVGNTSDAVEIKNGVEIKKSNDSFAYAGIIEDSSALGSGKNAIGVSANVGFVSDIEEKSSSRITQDDLSTVLEAYNITDSSYEAKKNSYLVSGDTIVSSDSTEYTLIIYGDANSDGTICYSADYMVIIDDYVNGIKAEGVTKMAADVDVDNKLNVFDISRLIWKALGYDGREGNADKLSGTLITKDVFAKTETGDDDDENEVIDGVAKIGNTGYETLQAAVDVAEYADTIVMLKDVDWESNESIATIASNKYIILDLAGHSLNLKSYVSDAFIKVDGFLSIKNSSLTKSKIAVDKSLTNTSVLSTVKVTGTLLVEENIRIDSTLNVIYMAGDGANVVIQGTEIYRYASNYATAPIYIYGNGRLYFKGGSVDMDSSVNQSVIAGNGGTSRVEITDGTFKYGGNYAITSVGSVTVGNNTDNTVNTSPTFTQKTDCNGISASNVGVFSYIKVVDYYDGEFNIYSGGGDVYSEDYIYNNVDQRSIPTEYKIEAKLDSDNNRYLIHLVHE